MGLVPQKYHFSKFFQIRLECSLMHALLRFLLLEPFRAHCVPLSQGACHFLECLVTIQTLVSLPHWNMTQGQNLVPLFPVLRPQHKLKAQEASTEGNQGYSIDDLGSH